MSFSSEADGSLSSSEWDPGDDHLLFWSWEEGSPPYFYWSSDELPSDAEKAEFVLQQALERVSGQSALKDGEPIGREQTESAREAIKQPPFHSLTKEFWEPQ